MRANPTELMDAGAPADIDVIFDDNVSRESGLRAHHQMITHDAIVRHVAVSQEDIIIADARVVLLLSRPVHAHVFAKNIAITHNQAGLATLVF